jgi:hypothetical protein
MSKHYYSKGKNDTLMPDLRVGDRVEVLMHSRTRGYNDTGGGWTSDWVSAIVTSVNRATADIRLDEYYFGYDHRMSYNRIRRMQNG